MDEPFVSAQCKDFRVSSHAEEVHLEWRWQDEDSFDALSTFTPEEAVQLGYQLIRAANRATAGRINGA